jgi:RNA polymerase sigma-70 factor, ECF subfamily
LSNHEAEWVRRAYAGDDEAFSCLVEAYQTPIYNLCYRMLGGVEEAEDAAQETFLRAYRNMKGFDMQRSFSTWLLSISAHYCIDQIRRRRMTFLSFEDLPAYDPPDLEPGPEASLLRGEDKQKVQKLLSSLSPQDRAAVVMRYWYDFSYEEIGDTLSLTVSAVKSRLHRSRRHLADQWATHGTQPIVAERTRHESPAF